MSDTVQSAHRVSSLSQALAQSSTLDAYKCGMKRSRAPAFKEVLSLESSNSSTAVTGITHRFTLSKNGVIAGALLKMRIRGMVAGAATNDRLAWGQVGGMLGPAMIQEIALKTHSRTLLTLDGPSLAEIIDKSPHRAAYSVLAGAALNRSASYGSDLHTINKLANDAFGCLAASSAHASYAAEATICVPLLFSPFVCAQLEDKYSSCVDTSFCETLIVECKLKPIASWCKLITEASGTANAATLPTSVYATLATVSQCVFDRAAHVALNHKSHTSLQLMWDRVNKIGESDTLNAPSNTAITRQVTKIKINSTDLTKQLVFVAVPDDPFQDSVPLVESVVFRASGRVIASQSIEDSRFAALCGDANAAAPSASAVAGSGFTTADKEQYASNALTLNFSDRPLHSDHWTGGIPLSGLSSMSCDITVRNRNNANYRVMVYSVAASIVSVAADSGAIVSSNSI